MTIIAMDSWTNLDLPVFYEAVTTADIWKFALLQRQPKCVVGDINLYLAPADLDNWLRILAGVLQF